MLHTATILNAKELFMWFVPALGKEVGKKTDNIFLQEALVNLIEKYLPWPRGNVIIHHYTETPRRLQLEIEIGHTRFCRLIFLHWEHVLLWREDGREKVYCVRQSGVVS